jgi:quinolinate synthase
LFQKKSCYSSHIYTTPEVQDIADMLVIHLALAESGRAWRRCRNNSFCRCLFLWQKTAALLSPNKKVLLPDLNAGCPMAAMASANKSKL